MGHILNVPVGLTLHVRDFVILVVQDNLRAIHDRDLTLEALFETISSVGRLTVNVILTGFRAFVKPRVLILLVGSGVLSRLVEQFVCGVKGEFPAHRSPAYYSGS